MKLNQKLTSSIRVTLDFQVSDLCISGFLIAGLGSFYLLQQTVSYLLSQIILKPCCF